MTQRVPPFQRVPIFPELLLFSSSLSHRRHPFLSISEGGVPKVQGSFELPELKELYSALIAYSVNEEQKSKAVVDALKRKHEAALLRSVGVVDLLARAKLVLKEERNNPPQMLSEVMIKHGNGSTTFLTGAIVGISQDLMILQQHLGK